MSKGCPFPVAGPETGLRVLRGMVRERSLLAALEMMRAEVGPAFQITLPGFQPAVLVGPDSNRQILVSQRGDFHWRSPADPVTKLLRHGLLVEDGEQHACLRVQMEPVLQKPQVIQHIPMMQALTGRVLAGWKDGSIRDMLVEMRLSPLAVGHGPALARLLPRWKQRWCWPAFCSSLNWQAAGGKHGRTWVRRSNRILVSFCAFTAGDSATVTW